MYYFSLEYFNNYSLIYSKKTEVVIFGRKTKHCCFWLRDFGEGRKDKGGDDDEKMRMAAEKAVKEAVRVAREKGEGEVEVDIKGGGRSCESVWVETT